MGIGIALATLAGGFAASKMMKRPKVQPIAQSEDPSIALKAEEESKRKARKQALADLNPTGTLGAGTPQTTRSKVLGV